MTDKKKELLNKLLDYAKENSNNSFKKFVVKSLFDDINSYDNLEDLLDDRTDPSSGSVSNLIYYEDTTAKYNEFQNEIHKIINDYAEDAGEFPKYIIDNFDDPVMFKNACVWFAWVNTISDIKNFLDI